MITTNSNPNASHCKQFTNVIKNSIYTGNVPHTTTHPSLINTQNANGSRPNNFSEERQT